MVVDGQWEGRVLYQNHVKLQADRALAWLENPKEILQIMDFSLTSDACRPSSLHHHLKEE